MMNLEEIFKEYDPKLELPGYVCPTIDLLEPNDIIFSTNEVIETKKKLIDTLQANRIDVSSLKTTVGYTNTLYEIVPRKGLRLSRVKDLQAELSFNMGISEISIEPLFERGAIGFIIPNKKHVKLPIKSIIESDDFIDTDYELPLIIGRTLTHKNIIIDLNEKGHMLVTGATGQGKSVLLNVIIASLLYKKHPSDLKLVLLDPVQIELSLYSIMDNHFLAKLPDNTNVVSDTLGAFRTLESLTREMNDRIELLMKANVRSFKEYNALFRKRGINPSRGFRYMPYIVVIIDNYADLVMGEGELYIKRLVSRAHLVGIHLILSTQRPSHDVIAKDIKTSFPVRIAFRMASREDSRMILDEDGAESLSGNGDAIYKDELLKLRVQVPFISTDEVNRIASFIGSQQGFDCAYPLPEVLLYSQDLECVDLNDRDILFDEAARLIVVHQQGSTSLIQRKFSIGYNRAGRLMDQLEAAGIVGACRGSCPREVLIDDEYSLEKLLVSLE
jgi:S-DNA-T family DNA segregation ATPase FtsK/SpoIIIE